MRRLFPLLLSLVGFVAPPASAASPPSVSAVSLAPDEAITLDGHLDEAAWARAVPITDFFGTQPVEGSPVEAATAVRVLADERFLYVGFECALRGDTDRVRGYVAAREDVNRDDQVGLYLDPFGDARRAYIFYINALGVQQDMVTTVDGYWSAAWDARFRSVAHEEPGRYSVEVAIPWRSLRFPVAGDKPWRIRFTRRFGASQAKAAWPPYRQDEGPLITQFGELHGVAPRRSGIGLELKPSLVVRTGLDADEEGALRWRRPGFPETVDPSLSVKGQLTPSLTLDATVNPDFSQVEADPNFIDNNLRFPLFLEERRSFFLEGKELFDDALFYSRSVVDPLYGVKLSGKQGPVSVAVLHALDETPSPSFLREARTPGFDALPERAMAFVSYAGSRLDLGGRSSLGVAYSDKEVVAEGVHHADHHGLQLDGIAGLDEVSSARGAIAVSETGEVGGERVRGLRGKLAVDRAERFGAFGLNGILTTAGYRAENGFQARSDRVEWSSWADARFEPSDPRVDWVRGGIWFSSSLQHLAAPEPDTAYAGGWTAIRLPGLTDVEVEAEGWRVRYAGRDFDGGTTTLVLRNQGLDALNLTLRASLGDAIRYADASPSFVRSVSVVAALRALRRLKLDLEYNVSALGWQEDLDVDQVYKARLRIGFTNAFSLRLIAQGAVDERLDLSALFEWRPSAGTAVFVGWGHRFVQEGKLRTAAIDLFLKGTVLIPL